MVVDEVVGVASAGGAVATKGAGFFLPFGKWNLVVTLIVFSILLVQGSVLSVQQHSLFPLLDKAVFPLVAADSKISIEIDSLVFSTTPKPDAWYKMPFSKWFWEHALFWINIISLLWLTYFLFLVIFFLMRGLNSTSTFVAIILSVLVFFFLTSFCNLLAFEASRAGVVRDSNPLNVIKEDLAHSVPFNGIVKLGRYFLDKGYAQKLLENPVIKVFSNIDVNDFNTTNSSGV
jgi:hypothetical protein